MEALTVQTTITEAEVYRHGCVVTLKGEVTLAQGENFLAVEGLPDELDDASVSLRMPQMVRQGQVRVVRENGLDDAFRADANDELTPQIDDLDRKMENVQLELDAWKGASQSAGPATLDCLERLPEVLERLSSELVELRAKRRELAQRRDEERQRRQRPRLEAHVTCDQAATVPLEIVCRSRNAGWSPSYDVLVDKVGEPLNVRMKAEVWQKTGDDWADVTLRLNTGTTRAAGDLPRFVPRYLSKYEPRMARETSRGFGMPTPPMMAMAKSASVSSEDTLGGDTGFFMGEVASPEAQVEEQATVTTYQMPGAQSLSSGGEAQVFTVFTQELAARYQVYTYPRKGEVAYLVARLDEEPSSDVLGQQLAIYLEGSYAGAVRIGASDGGEGYELPLGRDSRVRVHRNEEVHRSKRRLGGKVTTEHTCTITVESRRPEAAEFVVLEQVPVSRDKDIEVTVRDTSGASYDADRGELRWTYRIEPGYRLQLSATWSVSHAGDVTVEESERPQPSFTPGFALGSSTFCPICGAPLSAGSTFCLKCGTRIR